MGSLMGLMMMWMLHGMLTGDGARGGALVAFVAVHVLAGVVVIGGAVFAARLSPRVNAFLARMHRPTWSHVRVMLAAAALSALVVHGLVHGGIV